MYNSQKVFDLLNERKLKNRDLLEALGKNWNGSLTQVVNGDIRASKLEMIADFFEVSIDTFFDRKVDYPTPDMETTSTRMNSTRAATALAKLKVMEDLLQEKNERIKVLEDMIELLKSTKSIK